MSEAPAPASSLVAGGDAFSAAVKAAQEDIAQGVEKAGLRNDPIRYPLAAISTVLGLFPDFLRYMHDTAEEARQPLDAAALARMEKAAAEGASRASSALVRAHNRRSVVVGSLVVVLFVAAGLGGGYWWGRSDAITRFRLSESGFAAMMHDSPAVASGWLALARMNDYDTLMGACHGSRGFMTDEGRHACLAPLWLDDEKAAPPPAKAAKP